MVSSSERFFARVDVNLILCMVWSFLLVFLERNGVVF